MDISEFRVIYSPHYEGTNILIKWQFRLKKIMICWVWVQEHTPLNSHCLVLENRGTDFHDCRFVDSM